MALSFWMVTAVLLLLYGWTLTETAPLAVQVREGLCTAVVGERSSEIPCPDLDEIGLYLTSTPLVKKMWFRPFDLLTPRTVWDEVIVWESDGTDAVLVPGDGREISAGTAVAWPSPEAESFVLEAHVRRPDGEHAGILLLEPGSRDGLLFMVDSENRQATWWRWQDGQPLEAITGVPYQKPLLAQGQSLLRQFLATFLGALGIIFVVAVIGRLGRLASQRFSRSQSGSPAIPIPQSQIRKLKLSGPALLIVLAVFGMSLWIAVDVLERIPHVQDSITFLFQAQTLAGGALWAPPPPITEAFVQEFLTVWGGRWFGQYPPGYPAVLAVGILAGAPWLVNPWLAALTAALLVKLGVLLYRSSTGLLAGGLALLSPFFLFLSGSLMVHAAELYWTTLLMVGWTLALRRPYRARWALLAGSSLGMLLLTRQITAVAIGVSFVALMLVVEWWGWPRVQRDASQQVALKGLGRQAAWTLGAAFPFVLLLLGYQAALTGSPWQDPRLLARPFDLPGFGPHIGESENAFELTSLPEGTVVTWYTDPQQPPRGHSLARGLYNTEENLEELAGHLFGWYPLIALAFCWMPFLLRKPGRYDWVLLAVLLAVVAVYIAYWTTGIMFGPRYYYAALPALLLLTARGLQALSERFGAAATGAFLAVVVVVTLILYWPGAAASQRGYNFISREEQAVVEEQIEGQALVFIPIADWWDYGRFFSGNTPWLDGRIIYAHDLGHEQNTRLQQSYPGRASYLWQPDRKSVKALGRQ